MLCWPLVTWGDAFSTPATPRKDLEVWSSQLVLVWDQRDVLRRGFLLDLAQMQEVAVTSGGHLGARPAELGARVTIPGPDDRPLARVVRGDRGWLVEDLSGGGIAVLVDGEPAARAQLLTDGARIEVGPACFIFRHGYRREEPIIDEDFLRPPLPSLATYHSKLAAEYAHLARLAPSDRPVFVHGETGTGKERVARAVHELADRPGTFVAVNCAAIPEGMAEAMFFGHRRGAFTGANEDRPGFLRAAERGTLFLDELGDMPLAAQAVLLRALQEREVTAVGDTRPTKVDVRLVSATNQDIVRLVVQGKFRGDLFARLNGHELKLPPLAARREDIGLMVRAMAYDRVERVALSANASRALLTYPWPGNARELEHTIHTAIELAPAGVVQTPHLPERLRPPAPLAAASGAGTPPDPITSVDIENPDVLVALLKQHRGVVAAAARAAGTYENKIRRLIERFAIDLDALR